MSAAFHLLAAAAARAETEAGNTAALIAAVRSLDCERLTSTLRAKYPYALGDGGSISHMGRAVATSGTAFRVPIHVAGQEYRSICLGLAFGELGVDPSEQQQYNNVLKCDLADRDTAPRILY